MYRYCTVPDDSECRPWTSLQPVTQADHEYLVDCWTYRSWGVPKEEEEKLQTNLFNSRGFFPERIRKEAIFPQARMRMKCVIRFFVYKYFERLQPAPLTLSPTGLNRFVGKAGKLPTGGKVVWKIFSDLIRRSAGHFWWVPASVRLADNGSEQFISDFYGIRVFWMTCFKCFTVHPKSIWWFFSKWMRSG